MYVYIHIFDKVGQNFPQPNFGPEYIFLIPVIRPPHMIIQGSLPSIKSLEKHVQLIKLTNQVQIAKLVIWGEGTGEKGIFCFIYQRWTSFSQYVFICKYNMYVYIHILIKWARIPPSQTLVWVHFSNSCHLPSPPWSSNGHFLENWKTMSN